MREISHNLVPVNFMTVTGRFEMFHECFKVIHYVPTYNIICSVRNYTPEIIDLVFHMIR